MKLQLALDMVTIDQALQILDTVHPFIDIVEVGTPFIVHEGIRAVKAVKDAYPHLTVLADVKIMDAGAYETQMAIDAGADIVTVLAAANDETISACVRTAREHGAKIMVDMMNTPCFEERAKAIEELGADYICVHTAFDIQSSGADPIAQLHTVKQLLTCAGAAVAGGINMKTIRQVAAEQPEIVIVGGCITNAADKAAMASQIREAMKEGAK